MEKENMDNIIKKVAAINDISCLGGASLTEIIPVLSSLGIRTCPVPTVILSTHSGGYEDYTYHDLTSHMIDQGIHWQSLGVSFDAIYSGFLGSSEQVVVVEDFIDHMKDSKTVVMVDPVMGDNGKLYSSIDEKIVEQMKKLVTRADIITPNLTEAFLLADMPYVSKPDDKTILELLNRLRDFGAHKVIITSVGTSDDKIATIIYQNGKLTKVERELMPVDFPGTGDIFASTVLGLYLNGYSLEDATIITSDFLEKAIGESMKEQYSHRAGILLEAYLPELFKYNKFNQN
ncbi:MAG: pyridoxamine kinase [Tissierellia bacterium]|nr:pyridoxamine kinase [Tissierellia bacterium]